MEGYQCALCTDRAATTEPPKPREVAALVVQNTRLSIPEPDMTIPLCEPCAKQFAEPYRWTERTDDVAELRAANDRLRELAGRLNTSIIEAASQ